MENMPPNLRKPQFARYIRQVFGESARLLGAEVMDKSTQDAPWRLDLEVDGAARKVVLRLDAQRGEHEVDALRAMESIPIPTPRVYGWDPWGKALGIPSFLIDFIEGESLLAPVLAGEAWAEDLYLDTVCALQALTRQQLRDVGLNLEEEENAVDVLEGSYAYFKEHPHPLAEAVYKRLKESIPALPVARFGNGDLWLDNFIVRDRKLVGVIDFEGAGFSDPIFEFLLAFFVLPELRGRGLEERYCRRMGFDAGMLGWYHGLEYFDTWHWVVETGEAFVHYNGKNLPSYLEAWLVGN